jgi:hypothetical protein
MTGKIHNRNSSTRPFARRVCRRSELPTTWSSGPSASFRPRTAVATSPSISFEPAQSTPSSVLEATCLVAAFMLSAMGPSSNGQWAAKIS